MQELKTIVQYYISLCTSRDVPHFMAAHCVPAGSCSSSSRQRSWQATNQVQQRQPQYLKEKMKAAEEDEGALVEGESAAGGHQAVVKATGGQLETRLSVL